MEYLVNPERTRLDAVQHFGRFEFDKNMNLHGLLQLTAFLFETPVAFITLMDEHEQVFKVTRGFNVARMPRETSFCNKTIMQRQPLVVSDAFEDERFRNNPLVASPPNIRFYAGASLATFDGQNIGTLCIMDTKVKTVPEEQREMLDILAHQAMNIMELEVAYKLLNEKMDQVAHQNNVLMDIAYIQSHEFRGPLSTIMGLMNIMKDEGPGTAGEYIPMMEEAVSKLDDKIRMVVSATEAAKDAYIN